MGNEPKVVAKKVNFEVAATNIKDIIANNLGGEQLSARDLEKIEVPKFPSKLWMINTADGETERKQLEGILIHTKLYRRYYEAKFGTGESKVPPNCISEDMITGIGDPGGECITCPFNQFGTYNKGEGDAKACKEYRVLYMITKDSMLPVVINAAPGSLKYAKQYLISLTATHKIDKCGLITQLSVEPDKSKHGTDYNRIAFTASEKISNMDEVKAFAASLIPMIGGAVLDIATNN